jgi:hypothetical protein
LRVGIRRSAAMPSLSAPKGAWLVYPNYRHSEVGQRLQFFRAWRRRNVPRR